MRALGTPLVIGHRGASGYRPEHTRTAYRLAFALGADAVEPDIVATRDGVLVLRHENEISQTTDVATRREFADRRTTKSIDGESVTGWFTEDFTWPELATLRAVERLPGIRSSNATFDGLDPIMRLSDLLPLIDEASDAAGRPLRLVAELKHATYFESIGLPLDELFATEVAGWVRDETLITESFEQSVLDKLIIRGVPGKKIYLHEATGAAADLVARDGRSARTYEQQRSEADLAELARNGIHGISVDKAVLLEDAASRQPRGRGSGEPASSIRLGGLTREPLTGRALVERAHAHGLEVYSWTLRPENRFLLKRHRGKGSAADWGDWRAEFEAVLSTGVDGVFADHPDLVLDAIERSRLSRDERLSRTSRERTGD
ncbi:glycerophosphodiester phosphodiesterase family protein [Ruicaihuangia caeni]|uniref:glycerophosphodiester phosphodiesterase n=1 Tax=Ruicaihuangia caeni TaxID=3042517 RepID=A0AAW6TAN8_9MICO|nr:glycerophosphodiester phosphodiesterase family protein [Klugiella sp. YN-L-19]MDI2098637.1 glycerophosphodiester phosphodiesterase family protein [Klugiella sp. YN-L-19]